MEPRGQDPEGRSSKTSAAAPLDARPWRLLLFTVTGRQFAVPLAATEAVLRMPARLTRIPGAPPAVLGALAREGEVFPVIQLDTPTCSWVAVLRLSAGLLGVALRAAPLTLTLPADRLSPQPSASPLLSGRARLDDGTTAVVLDPQDHTLTLPAVIAAFADAEGE